MERQEPQVIYVYTREMALEDGVIVSAGEIGRELGFKLDIALSASLYHRYVVPPQGLEEQCQSVSGRMRDVMHVFAHAAYARWDGSRVEFDVVFQMKVGRHISFEKVHCIAAVEGDKDGNPAITIFLPEDD